MNHWLVCFSSKTPARRRAAIIRSAGAALSPEGDPAPLGQEIAVPVDADAAAVETLRAHSEVRGVYPDSEMRAY